MDAGAEMLTLQKGLGSTERVAQSVPRHHVLFVCTITSGDLRRSGHVASHGPAYAPFTTPEPGCDAQITGQRLA